MFKEAAPTRHPKQWPNIRFIMRAVKKLRGILKHCVVEAGLHGLAYLFFTGGSMGVLRYALRTGMDSLISVSFWIKKPRPRMIWQHGFWTRLSWIMEAAVASKAAEEERKYQGNFGERRGIFLQSSPCRLIPTPWQGWRQSRGAPRPTGRTRGGGARASGRSRTWRPPRSCSLKPN